MKKLKKIVLIIVIIIVIDIAFSNLFRPFGLSLYIHAYTSSIKADNYLEEKYLDDDFYFEGVTVDRSSELFDFSPIGYIYEFSAKGYEERVQVVGELKGNDFYDSFQPAKYESSAVDTLKKCFDNYFGENNYCWYLDHHRDGPDNLKVDGGLYSYAVRELMPIFLIVSSDFNYDSTKTANEITANLESIIDITKYPITINIFFDKKDNISIFKETMIKSRIFFNYRDLNLWDKELIIENEQVDDSDYTNPQYSNLEYKWKTNDQPNFEYKTKNKFLNGEKLEFVIDGYTFYIDGNTKVEDLITKSSAKFVGDENMYIKPSVCNEEEIVLYKNDGTKCRMDISFVNDTNKMLKIKDAKIYSISIGSIYDVDEIGFSNISIGGMKIGDDFDEDEITKRFGPYESKERTKAEAIIYTFVDGEDTIYDLMDSYCNMFRISVKDGKIQNIHYRYINSEDFYYWDYQEYENPEQEIE